MARKSVIELDMVDAVQAVDALHMVTHGTSDRLGLQAMLVIVKHTIIVALSKKGKGEAGWRMPCLPL